MIEKELLTRLFRDLRPARWHLIIGTALYVPVTLLSVIQPVIIGYAVQYGMIDGGRTSIVAVASVFFCAVVLLAICELAQGLCLQITGQMMVANLRQKAFTKVQKLSMGFLDSTPMGRLLTRLTNDAESVAEMFSMGAVQILGDVLFLIGTFIMLFLVDFDLSLYSALVLPLLAAFVYFFRKWTRSAYMSVRESLSDLNSFLQEYLSGIVTVQLAGRIKKIHRDFDSYNQKFMLTNRHAILLDAASYSLVDGLSYLTSAVVLWGAFRLKLDHALSLGVLVAFLEALSRFFQPVRELSSRYSVFQSALVSLERIYQLFEWPEEEDEAIGSPVIFNNEIEFKDVGFYYQEHEPVLDEVSFSVKKGERIALVGHTGAGKSTAIKLLNRFYKCTSGEILIDGRNIDDIALSDLRRLISVVPQDVFMFRGTLRDNLSFGYRGASDKEIWKALDVVQLSDMLKKKGGLQLKVASKGQNFSLGERQLLALARALVTDPPILVLDEATASVDAVTESKLQTATKELLKKRTALVIAHRLSTIMDADRILVFHKGRIAEAGAHRELMKKNGIYSNLIKLQEHASSGFSAGRL